MPIFGVTPQGLVRKPLVQIIADLKIRFQARFGDNIDVRDAQPFGQLATDIAALIDEPWQVTQDIYTSFDPDQATGTRLVAIASITGTFPKTPTKSTTIGVGIGPNGSIVPAGTQVQVVNSGPIYQSVISRTIIALTAWSSYTAALGDLRVNTGKIYYCIVPGNTASSGPGPTATGSDISDNVAHWRYIGVGNAAVAIPMESLGYGSFPAGAGQLTLIVNPSGLTSFTNPKDAVLGQEVESEAQFRARRNLELNAKGEGGIDSMTSDLLRISGIIGIPSVAENKEDVEDLEGRPPHSVEAIVLGGSDEDVASVVFTKGAGINTFGNVTTIVNDIKGNPHTVKFSRPNLIDIFVSIHVLTDSFYPIDGDEQIRQTIVDWSNGKLVGFNLGTGLSIGNPVITSKIEAAVTINVPGVVDIPQLFIGVSNPPTSGANITSIGIRDLASFDTSRIEVISTSS